MSKTLVCLFFGGALALATSCGSGSDGDGDADTDTDVDIDSDTDSDIDSDSDSDSDSDAAADGDPDGDADGDSDDDDDDDEVRPWCGDGSCDSGETSVDCPADCCRTTLSVGPRRGSDSPTLVRPAYDYAPSVMHDGVYRMWWCGGVAGDHILYAEADRLDGPWHARGSGTSGTYDDVFQPTGDPSDFDGTHTCDPSVVRVHGTYYMYYGGYPSVADGDTTRIGVATSEDGLSWARLNGGRPIVVPARDHRGMPNPYGAGQPSVVWLDGYFYLIFTDTTGLDSNPGNGAGQYVMRSADPTFQTGVEELQADGFRSYDPARHTAHRLFESFSVDWQFIDALDAFAVASHTASGVTRVHLFDRALLRDVGELEIPGSWHEGPGVVSRPDKHAVPAPSCGPIPFDVMRALGPDGVMGWDMGPTGADLLTGLDCECLPLARMFEGTLLAVPDLPLTLVVGGERLQFALAPPAMRFARGSYAPTSAMFHAIPYGASMAAGVEVLGAPERPAAFHLDDGRLWPVSCLEAITDNGSSIHSVSQAEWDAIPMAHSLYCVR